MNQSLSSKLLHRRLKHIYSAFLATLFFNTEFVSSHIVLGVKILYANKHNFSKAKTGYY